MTVHDYLREITSLEERRAKSLPRRLHLTDEYGLSGFGLLVSMVAACIALAAVIGAIAIPIEVANCHQGAERVGRVTGHYQFPTGCYYRLPSGREVPQGNYPPKWIRLSR